MINNIQVLYSRINDKKKFIELVANDFNKSFTGLHTNWFSSWKIPQENQERLHTLLINFLKQEIKLNEKLIRDEN